MKMVAEGVATAVSAHDLAARYHVDMPICSQVYAILFEGKNPAEAMRELMTRELKQEV